MRFMIMIQLLGTQLRDGAATFIERERTFVRDHKDLERGSVTIENVLWAVAVIAIVAIVVTAITAYVTSQAGKLQ